VRICSRLAKRAPSVIDDESSLPTGLKRIESDVMGGNLSIFERKIILHILINMIIEVFAVGYEV